MGLVGVDHPARYLLRQYRNRGGSVVLLGKYWTEGQWKADLERGTHKSMMVRVPFLR